MPVSQRSGRSGAIGKGVSVAAGGGASNQGTVGDVEVRVPLDEAVGRVVVEGILHLLEERGDGGVVRTGGGELGDPDGLVGATGLMDLGYIVEEVAAARGRVPMSGAEAELALAVAGADPLLQPAHALAIGPAVGDSGGAEADRAGMGGQVLDVSRSGSGGVHVGLTRVVGLVEAEEVLGTVADGSLGVGVPGRDEVRPVAPKHGDVLQGAVNIVKTIAHLAPVVSPANLAAGSNQRGDKAGDVVSGTTLVAGSRSRSRSSRSHGRSRRRRRRRRRCGGNSCNLRGLKNLGGSSRGRGNDAGGKRGWGRAGRRGGSLDDDGRRRRRRRRSRRLCDTGNHGSGLRSSRAGGRGSLNGRSRGSWLVGVDSDGDPVNISDGLGGLVDESTLLLVTVTVAVVHGEDTVAGERSRSERETGLGEHLVGW